MIKHILYCMYCLPTHMYCMYCLLTHVLPASLSYGSNSTESFVWGCSSNTGQPVTHEIHGHCHTDPKVSRGRCTGHIQSTKPLTQMHLKIYLFEPFRISRQMFTSIWL